MDRTERLSQSHAHTHTHVSGGLGPPAGPPQPTTEPPVNAPRTPLPCCQELECLYKRGCWLPHQQEATVMSSMWKPRDKTGWEPWAWGHPLAGGLAAAREEWPVQNPQFSVSALLWLSAFALRHMNTCPAGPPGRCLSDRVSDHRGQGPGCAGGAVIVHTFPLDPGLASTRRGRAGCSQPPGRSGPGSLTHPALLL